jgi:hypothetical protein
MNAVLFMNLRGLWILLPISFAFQEEVNMLSSKKLDYLMWVHEKLKLEKENEFQDNSACT